MHVRARLGLGEREAGELAAGAEVGQEARLLLVGAEQHDALHPDRLVHAHDHRERRVDLREHLRHAAVARLGEPLAAVLLGHVEAHQAALAQLGDRCRRRSSGPPRSCAGRTPRPTRAGDAVSARILSCSASSGLGNGKTISSWISPRNSDFANEETPSTGRRVLRGGGGLHQAAGPRTTGRGPGPDVLGRGPDQPGLALLLEDVGRPARHARAGEERGEQVGRHLREVEHHRGPELDVGGQHAVGLARVELGQGRLLERLRHLHARRADLLRGSAQHAGARILRAVDPVAEAHQPLAAVEPVLHPGLGVAVLGHGVEHRQHARGRAAVQRAPTGRPRRRRGLPPRRRPSR